MNRDKTQQLVNTVDAVEEHGAGQRVARPLWLSPACAQRRSSTFCRQSRMENTRYPLGRRVAGFGSIRAGLCASTETTMPTHLSVQGPDV